MNKVQANEINLTTNEALVLQQVYEDGSNDAAMLAVQMGMPRRTAMNVLADLRHKGLMAIDQAYGDAWVRLTTRETAGTANLAGSSGDSCLSITYRQPRSHIDYFNPRKVLDLTLSCIALSPRSFFIVFTSSGCPATRY